MSSLGVGELLISLIILVKSSSLLQSMILLATSSFDIGLIGVNALNCLSNNGGELPSASCFLCVHDIIHGSLNIAENCDMLYGIGFCGILCKRANAEYVGLVIELYVGGCGVKAMNLF
nr:hypothetical protein [Tanacetum cinerariifolium]